jgi:hypothetical protein
MGDGWFRLTDDHSNPNWQMFLPFSSWLFIDGGANVYASVCQQIVAAKSKIPSIEGISAGVWGAFF